MKVDSSIAALFDSLRPAIAERMFASVSDPTNSHKQPASVGIDANSRKQVEAILEHLGNFLITNDLRMHRDFLQALLAMRNTHTQTYSTVMSSLAELGDTAARMVQGAGDTSSHRFLAQKLVNATSTTIRICNELVAKDLDRKVAQRDQLRGNPVGKER
jgi:hypothetical protein